MFTTYALLLCLGTLTPIEKETRYLAFQIFTYSPYPASAAMGEGDNHRQAGVPPKKVLAERFDDIKRRIGIVGNAQHRLAVMLGPISFDHTDAEVTQLIKLGFDIALEKGIAVGFHIDDSMFWTRRKDLWKDPQSVEAMDWEGTPSTGRRLDWGPQPSATAPQMCFNSKSIVREVRARSARIGREVVAGMKRLSQARKPDLFAGVIAGWETMIGKDFETGKYLGYRALMNRGFRQDKPPKNIDLERERVVKSFILLWTSGLAKAGVIPTKIYSHTAFQAQNGQLVTSQANHFAPPSVAFGKSHRPGFSTYPQPGNFKQIYAELTRHKQVGWASSEGTNMLPEGRPDQTGMGMETYLAAMFNHGATLVNIFSWGIGGEAGKESGFRVVTEREEALQAYRKFLRGEKLIEKWDGPSLMERLPDKIRRIQKELPAWMRKAGRTEEAALQMQNLDAALKAQDFAEAERIADAILKMIGSN